MGLGDEFLLLFFAALLVFEEDALRVFLDVPVREVFFFPEELFFVPDVFPEFFLLFAAM